MATATETKTTALKGRRVPYKRNHLSWDIFIPEEWTEEQRLISSKRLS